MSRSENISDNSWDFLRPHMCMPPDVFTATVSEEKRDGCCTNWETSDSDTSFSTADSTLEEDGEDQDTELQNFIMAEMLIDKICMNKGDKLPNNMSDEIIYCDDKGKFHKLTSALTWQKSKCEENRVDCALQISASELVKETSVAGQASKHSLNCSAVDDTSLEEEDSLTPCSKKQLQSRDSTTACMLQIMKDAGDGFSGKHSALIRSKSENLHLRDGRSLHNSDYEHRTVDSLIEHIEDLLKNEGDCCSEADNSNLNVPVQQLSPTTKREVHSFLREAAESFDLSDVSIDESRSSLQLLRSIIAEAGKQYGFLDCDWLQQLAEDVSTDTVNKSPEDQTTPPLPESKSKRMPSQIPVPIKKVDANSSKACHSSPLPVRPTVEKHVLPIVSKSVGKTDQSTGTPTQHKQRHSKKQMPPLSAKSTGHINSGDDSNVVERRPCVKASEEKLVTEFHSCKQHHLATRGVKVSPSRKRCHCIRRLLMKKPSDHKVKMPAVEAFTTSTKAGASCFFEILRTRLSVPENDHKKSIVGATIPIPLQSQALWTNGELSVQVKEIDKDTLDIPIERKHCFTRMPHTISIDFIREHKMERSCCKLSKPCSMVRQTTPKPERSNLADNLLIKPFNTKVDHIFKRDPLVLGTLDRKVLGSKNEIQQHKLRRTDIPAYCVV